MDYSFRHLDPSVTKTYGGTVLYGIESDDICLLIRVKAGYVAETPSAKGHEWIRGQHISTLEQFFNAIKPLRWISNG